MNSFKFKPRNKAHIDFSSIDLGGALERLREGRASEEDKSVLASFSGSFLRYLQDEPLLKDSGIIRK